MSTDYIIGGVGNVNPSIKWQEGAVCFANGKQWFACNLPRFGDIVSEDDTYLDFARAVTPFDNDLQLNTIKQGDYIEASELGTEQKYNDVVEVFGLFGFGFQDCGVSEYDHFVNDDSLTCCNDGLWQVSGDIHNKRKLTYSQIMAIGELKRLEIERGRQRVEDDFIDRFGFGVISRSEEREVNFQPYDIDGESLKSAIDKVKELESEDVVNKPSHYQFFEGVEVIEIIASSMTREQFKGYCLGNRIKYRLRAGNKDKLEQEIAKSDKYVELYDEHKHLCRIDGDLK